MDLQGGAVNRGRLFKTNTCVLMSNKVKAIEARFLGIFFEAAISTLMTYEMLFFKVSFICCDALYTLIFAHTSRCIQHYGCSRNHEWKSCGDTVKCS